MTSVRIRTGVAALVFTLLGVVVSAPVASAAPRPTTAPANATLVGAGLRLSTYEFRLLILINRARAQAHLPVVRAEPGSTDVARRWSLRQAAEQQLAHNPALTSTMAKGGSKQWRRLAENVGEGPADAADDLFRAYMTSPEHRANILSRSARVVGIGTVQVDRDSDALAWNTIVFTDNYSASYGRSRTSATGTLQSWLLPTLATLWRVQI